MSRYTDTIVGPATAPGEAGVGIVRLSGADALGIAWQVFRAKSGAQPQPWRMMYGEVIENDQVVDEALMVYMKGPKSYTAEDVVEIQCHGGGLILKKILELCLSLGARIAGPGEFTERAFLNGRIDLTQAEAVGDLVHAKTDKALSMVINQLKGNLHERILDLKGDISWVLALLGASIDFPEEDVVFAHQKEIREKLGIAQSGVQRLLSTAKAGQTLQEGFSLVIVGRPNVGKSSLLNGLLNQSRAIVTDIPGTTRDSISEEFQIQGVPIRLVDTAGLRETEDQVEKLGIKRSLSELAKADLMLWVVDGAQPNFDLEADLASVEAPLLMVLNKDDLTTQPVEIPSLYKDTDKIALSAHLPQDIDRLKERIFRYITGVIGPVHEDSMLTNLRQEQAAQKGLDSINQAIVALESGAGEELLSVELVETLAALGEIVGETTPDEMLGQIFSNFCIGK